MTLGRLVLFLILCSAGCAWRWEAQYIETTRVFTTVVEGRSNAYQETTAAVLLPRVPVPAPGRVGTLQEISAAHEERPEIQVDDESTRGVEEVEVK